MGAEPGRLTEAGIPPLPRGESRERRARLLQMPLIQGDPRGDLSFGELYRHVPFEVKRYFLVFGVSDRSVRGEHAHLRLHQMLLCVHGSCEVVIDDGERRQAFTLDHPSMALHVPPMIWSTQQNYSEDAVLLVLASDFYDPADYIRDYAEFCARLRASRPLSQQST